MVTEIVVDVPEQALPACRTVFLFGAGASYGAGGVSPSAPPLGKGLFDVLVHRYPWAWGALQPPVARKFREEGFEVGMGWVWRNMPDAPQVLQKCLGHFFCGFGLGDANASAYVRLLRRLTSRPLNDPIVLATLNYEMVLEDAASHARLVWNYGDALLERSQALIVKPHGSCNFISGGLSIHHGFGRIGFDSNISFESKMKVLSRREALAYCRDPQNGLYPAIVAFMKGKPTQVCTSAIRAMQDAFKSAVMAAERVAIVGVNPHIVDYHIWNCLAQTSAEISFCGDEYAFGEWSTNHRGMRPTRYLGAYFGDVIDALAELVQ